MKFKKSKQATAAHQKSGKGKLKPAISEWEKVLQLDPHHTRAGNNLQKAKRMMNATGRQNDN